MVYLFLFCVLFLSHYLIRSHLMVSTLSLPTHSLLRFIFSRIFFPLLLSRFLTTRWTVTCVGSSNPSSCIPNGRDPPPNRRHRKISLFSFGPVWFLAQKDSSLPSSQGSALFPGAPVHFSSFKLFCALGYGRFPAAVLWKHVFRRSWGPLCRWQAMLYKSRPP